MSRPVLIGTVYPYGRKVQEERAIVEEIERQIGHRLRVRVTGKTMLRLIGIFSPLMREMVEMHYLNTDPVLMDDSALHELIGPIRKTPYPDGVKQCLSATRVSAPGERH